jgi:uncharacterized protein YjbJ (UPF0337 family)
MSARTKQWKGRIKQAAAAITGDRKKEREGRVERRAGEAEERIDQAADKASEMIDRASDAVKGTINKASRK